MMKKLNIIMIIIGLMVALLSFNLISCAEESSSIGAKIIPDWADAGVYLNIKEAKKNEKMKKVLDKRMKKAIKEAAGNLTPDKITSIIGGIKLPNNIENIAAMNPQEILKNGVILFISTEKGVNLGKTLQKEFKSPIKTVDGVDIYKDSESNLLLGHFSEGMLVSNEAKLDDNIKRAKGSTSNSIMDNEKLSGLVKRLNDDYKIGWAYIHINENIHKIIDANWMQVAMFGGFLGDFLSPFDGIEGIKKIIDEITVLHAAMKIDGDNLIIDLGFDLKTKETSKKLSDGLNKLKEKLAKLPQIDEEAKKYLKELKFSQKETSVIISFSSALDDVLKNVK